MENKKYVSLNKKILTYSLIITTITLIIINYLTVFLENNTINIEKELTEQDMSRVYNSINNAIEQMNALNVEYSCWDSTKNYIKGTYPELIEENFMDETFESNSWHTIILYNLEESPVYQKGYSTVEGQEVPVEQELLDLIQSASYFDLIENENDSVSGIINLEKGTMILTIFPILTSFNEGPVSGYFVTGRYLDEIFVEELSKLTNYELTILNNVQAIKGKMINGENINKAYVWTLIEKSNITGYITLFDLSNEPTLTLQYSRPMTFLASSKKTVNLYVGIIILIFVFNFMGILMLVNRMFVKRLNIMLKHIGSIIFEKDLSTRVDINSNDEFSILSKRFNEMLDEIEKLNKQLLYKAQIDQLTDLPNRHYFYDLVNERIQKSNIKKAAILFLDLDKFKEINDTYGHNVGDEFLKEFAITVKNILNDDDIICRLGGDEFAIWINQYKDQTSMKKYADKILSILKEPIEVYNFKLNTIPSIGISLYPEHGTDLDMLIDNADYAMYQAKKNQNGYAIYRDISIDESLKQDFKV